MSLTTGLATRLVMASIAAWALLGSAGTWAQVKWQEGMLTDDRGVPLFVSDADPPGVSLCKGACLGLWLPYRAPAQAAPQGELSIIQRDDGVLQWAFRDKPLYHWFNFDKPMDGQGMRGGNWHVIRRD